MTNPDSQAQDSPPQQGAPHQEEPINLEVLVSRCMGSRSFALMLLGELESHTGEQVEAILRHAHAGEAQAAAEVAHALKGASAIVGAEPLCRASAAAERAGRAGDLSQLVEFAAELRTELDRCLTEVGRIRTQLQYE